MGEAMKFKSAQFGAFRTLFLGLLLVGLFTAIFVARAVIWNTYGGGGNPIVLVHPVIEAAINDYDACLDDAGNADPSSHSNRFHESHWNHA